MKTIGLMVGPALASTLSINPGILSALSPVLIWSTVLVWMAIALMLASVATVLARQAGPQLRAERVRTPWTGCVPLCACAAGAR